MDVGKTAFWNGDGRSWRRNVGENFGFLACEALPSPDGYVSGHMGPDKKGGKQTASGLDTWVAKGVDMIKNLLLERQRDQRAKNGSGDIT
jgi:hypothetical protein